ncbi:twin-arginine translocase TatA/TatE family subunit [Pedobacter fastidiosus]|uniref:Twin-arginine translocase TatA/TatE family subunit n=1 Tax=Pedobacter fastidiosus TaxID=2765361 RepID=A0ABR7KWG8_9SPHI|nr:twin-arginine translocase TatA/TatE family subunit [Pedobacter fastidiosus]MBC6112043.1 twin-arginine translocase TatA/TatE family subunit [Pedobacter fastidiosus]
MSVLEIILIGAVIILIFEGKKLPELMKGIGKSIREFKAGKEEPPVK